MPLPLIPIIAALAAGGTLVPHAAGGMIVTSATGYVAGTYLSTAAIGSILAAGSTALGAGALYLSGVAGSVIGSAGVFGTTVGATGVTGALMSGGAAIGGAVGLGYGGYRLFKLKRKIASTASSDEAQFSETDAKIVEQVIKRLSNQEKSNDRS